LRVICTEVVDQRCQTFLPLKIVSELVLTRKKKSQEEQASVREIKWDAFKKYSEDQLEAEQQHAAEVEQQVSALKHQLEEAKIHYKQKVGSEFSYYAIY
jgi:hypothetical protein